MSVYGINEFQKNVDTKIMYYLMVSQEASKSFKLTDLAYEMTDMGGYDKPLNDWRDAYIKEYKAEHKEVPINEIDGSNFSYEWFPLEEILAPYASGDTDCTLRIFNVLWEKTKDNDKWIDLILNFYPRLTVTLARMEANGVKADEDYMAELDKAYEEEEARLVGLIRDDANVQMIGEEKQGLYEMGLAEMAKKPAERDKEVAKFKSKYKGKTEFNPNSPDDKGRLLFDILGARPPASKETVKDKSVRKKEQDLEWSDYKTDKHNVAWIKTNMPEHEYLMDLFTRYSSVKTLRSTFVVGLSKEISNKDYAVHGSFNSTGTDTTRLSSSGPNLQNIPSSHQNVNAFDYAYPIKRIFISRFEGGAIAQLDYSALEMRILALIAKDDNMIQGFIEGKDTHKNTASMVFGKPEEEITSDERQASKAVAFGISYGQGVGALAEKLDISQGDAQVIYDKFLNNKPQIKVFIEETHKAIEENGYVETLQGHRRILRDVWGDQQTKAGALRQSVNTIIQGTGAYLTNLAVIMINDYLLSKNKKSKLVATVHDSIVIDMPHEEVAEVVSVSKFIMENLPIDFLMVPWEGETIRFPVTADAEIGTSYKDVVDFDAELFAQFNSVEGYTTYHKDIGKFEDYEATGLITKEQRDEGIAMVESNLGSYTAL